MDIASSSPKGDDMISYTQSIWFQVGSDVRVISRLLCMHGSAFLLFISCIHTAGLDLHVCFDTASSKICFGIAARLKLHWLHIQTTPDLLPRSHMTQYLWGCCSWSTVEGTLRVHCSFCMDSTPVTAGTSYPQSIPNSTPFCSSISGTASYETFVAGWRNMDV